MCLVPWSEILKTVTKVYFLVLQSPVYLGSNEMSTQRITACRGCVTAYRRHINVCVLRTCRRVSRRAAGMLRDVARCREMSWAFAGVSQHESNAKLHKSGAHSCEFVSQHESNAKLHKSGAHSCEFARSARCRGRSRVCRSTKATQNCTKAVRTHANLREAQTHRCNTKAAQALRESSKLCETLRKHL